MRWFDYVIKALENLGGHAQYSELYAEIRKIRPEPYTKSWKATVRNTIESYSSDSDNWRPNNPDVFYSVNGLGSGCWGIRGYGLIPIDKEVPSRISMEVSRIIRDSKLAKDVKAKNKHECQLCSSYIKLPNGNRYAEAHHIKPLGKPHSGPDIEENIICVCPNHHAMLDYGVIKLNKRNIKMSSLHKISKEFIDYHNQEVYGKNT